MKVLVYGASGWTGRMVAGAAHARGLDVVLGGRRSEALSSLARALSGVEARVIDSACLESLARAFADVGAVINCAGPSADLGVTVIDAAIRAGVHYLDVSGEETFVKRVYGSRDARAHAADIVVAPAFAGKGALGDWAASMLSDSLHVDSTEIAIAYAHTSAGFVKPSLGSALSAAGQGFLRLRDRSAIALEREFSFPSPFGRGWAIRVPGAEDISVLRHTRVQRAATYIAIDPGAAINAVWRRVILGASPIMPAIATAMLSVGGRRALGASLQTPILGGAPSFAAVIEGTDRENRCGLAILAQDAYSVTAEIAVLGAEALLHNSTSERGVLAPAQVCPPAAALRELERRRAILVLHADVDAPSHSPYDGQTWS